MLVLESGTGLTEMYHVTGLEQFSYLLVDHPDLVEEWLEAATRRSCGVWRRSPTRI